VLGGDVECPEANCLKIAMTAEFILNDLKIFFIHIGSMTSASTAALPGFHAAAHLRPFRRPGLSIKDPLWWVSFSKTERVRYLSSISMRTTILRKVTETHLMLKPFNKNGNP
jgi:hypothetical protein